MRKPINLPVSNAGAPPLVVHATTNGPVEGGKQSRRRRWRTTGSFNIVMGRWTREPFEIDSELMEAVTTYVAVNDVSGVIRRQVCLVTGAVRLTVQFGEAAA